MSKIFLTYDQQIEKLVKDKNLQIADTIYAKKILRQNSYYSLIGGYKDIFKNPTTKKYKDGTKFEDIVELYKLGIVQKGTQYVQGKKDMFSLVISLR